MSALILLAGAMLIALTRGSLRTAIVLATPLLAFVLVWLVPDGVSVTAKFLKYSIELVEGSPLRRLFGATFALITFAAGLYGLRRAKWYELSAGYALAAGALGVAFAGDFITYFLLWQMMVVFSTALIWCGGTPEARAAGIRYAILHLIGGLIFKIGLEGVLHETGSIDLRPLVANDIYTVMLLAGMLVSAAAAPVSVWLTDAYPKSSPMGSVFLPAFMTTSAILTLLLSFPGTRALIVIGLIMIFYGTLYGLFENNARRLLAYTLIHQLGFILCAIGIGTPTALTSAAAISIAHALSMTLLFMTASAVLQQAGRENITTLGSLARAMPFTALCTAVGALSISALPLAAGLTTLAVAPDTLDRPTYWLLATGAASIFLLGALKYPWFVFFRPERKPGHAGNTNTTAAETQPSSSPRPTNTEPATQKFDDVPRNMTAAMGLLAAITLALGILPQPLYAFLQSPAGHTPYSLTTMLFYLPLLLISGITFLLLRPLMTRASPIPVDIDWLWRVPLFRLSVIFITSLRTATNIIRDLYTSRAQSLRQWTTRWLGAEGHLSRPWPIGTTALWVAVLLTLYVLIYYFAL